MDLPKEIWREIFDRASICEWRSLSCVCKTFAAVLGPQIVRNNIIFHPMFGFYKGRQPTVHRLDRCYYANIKHVKYLRFVCHYLRDKEWPVGRWVPLHSPLFVMDRLLRRHFGDRGVHICLLTDRGTKSIRWALEITGL